MLVLGSFPGEESLRKQQYYGNARNLFWTFLGDALGENLREQSYEERLQTVLHYRVGLWDVFASCERVGSLDNAIRSAVLNDFNVLQRRAPLLERVCFNGKAAGKYAPKLAVLGYETVVLPSTSPANHVFDRIIDSHLFDSREELAEVCQDILNRRALFGESAYLPRPRK